MADRDQPRVHVIEAARSGKAQCQSCGQPIAEGELRLSEAYVPGEGRWARAHQHARAHRHRELQYDDDRRYHDQTSPDLWARFHHLTCAAQQQPYKLRSALASTSLDIPDRELLEHGIERALSAVDVAEDNAETRDEYLEFVSRLRENPDDELSLVFGDWLQSVGDPRGELVAVQHAAETATGEDRVKLADTERSLFAAHRKQLLPERLDGTYVWRRGFIHRVVLSHADPTSLARAFAHPSMRLLRELAVEVTGWSSIVIAANLPTPLPATLRVLELVNTTSPRAGLGAVGALLADALPQLVRMKLHGAAELAELRHPGLVELELVAGDAGTPAPATAHTQPRSLVERLAELDAQKLPALARLILRVERGHADAVAALAPELAAKLVRDEPAAVPPAPPAKVGEWLVRHTRKPEWGTGRVVEESEAGLEVEFEHGGKKLVRNVELLEEI